MCTVDAMWQSVPCIHTAKVFRIGPVRGKRESKNSQPILYTLYQPTDRQTNRPTINLSIQQAMSTATNRQIHYHLNHTYTNGLIQEKKKHTYRWNTLKILLTIKCYKIISKKKIFLDYGK